MSRAWNNNVELGGGMLGLGASSSSSSSNGASGSAESQNSGYVYKATSFGLWPNDDDDEEEEETWLGLSLTHRGFVALPLDLCMFSHLTGLFINNNKIQVLPGAIFESLTQLRQLDFSFNQIAVIPEEIGNLRDLEELRMSNNLVSELPVEIGRLCSLRRIVVKNNPLRNPPQHVIAQGTLGVVGYLRDQIPAPSAPAPRKWMSYGYDMNANMDSRFRVLCYNILSEKYATEQMYHYCASWALSWEYRKVQIMDVLLRYNADILCLQEVEEGKFFNLFLPQLQKHGYCGLFLAKSRAKQKSPKDRASVDGCAIFYNAQRFQLVERYEMEFSQLAMKKARTLRDTNALQRLMTRDNVALGLLLEVIDENTQVRGQPVQLQPGTQSHSHGYNPMAPADGIEGHNEGEFEMGNAPFTDYQSVPRYVFVANTHIHWDPRFADVKLLQVQFLMEEIQRLTKDSGKAWKDVPVIICGDLNSTVDSGVVEFMKEGHVAGTHPELQEFNFGDYTENGLQHSLSLDSAYAGVNEKRMYTNYTNDFKGVLDWIFYDTDRVLCTSILEPVPEKILKREVALPSSHFPSDHVPLAAEFELLPLMEKKKG